ncbi:MAG: MFS transporter [Bdellovibrionales bacterium]|nr:MFS transporter [Bdellovibrionales bacterium]
MKKKSALLVIFVTVFIDLIGFGMIIPLSPYLAREFDASDFQVGLLMSIYSLMQFFFAPMWGRISDYKGRKPIILLSLVGAGLAHIMFAFASSYWGLFLARTLAGFFGANIATAMAYVADVTDEGNRSKQMGLIGAAFGLGFIFGPFFGAELARFGEYMGDMPPFGSSFAAIGAGSICLLNAVFAFFVLEESLIGQVAKKKTLMVHERVKLLFKYIKKPVVGVLLQTTFVVTFSMALMEATLFLFVQDLFDWELRKAGYGFAYVGIIMVSTQGYLIRKWMPKFGEKKLLIAGAILLGLGLMGIALSDTVAVLAVAVTSLGVGTGLLNPSIVGSISLLSDKTEQGMSIGVNQSFSALGRIIGPAVGGWFYQVYGLRSPFWLATATSVIALLMLLLIFKNLPDKGKAQEE